LDDIGELEELLVVVVGGLGLTDVLDQQESGLLIKLIDQVRDESVALGA
jgi:hypothetical protein